MMNSPPRIQRNYRGREVPYEYEYEYETRVVYLLSHAVAECMYAASVESGVPWTLGAG